MAGLGVAALPAGVLLSSSFPSPTETSAQGNIMTLGAVFSQHERNAPRVGRAVEKTPRHRCGTGRHEVCIDVAAVRCRTVMVRPDHAAVVWAGRRGWSR